ncbi:MAG: hypothetical protein ABI646_09280 [Acidobacteriota bacterium]
MHFHRSILALSIAALLFASAGVAQTKRRTKAATKTPPGTAAPPTPGPSPVEPVVVTPESKKNERPAANGNSGNGRNATKLVDPTYFYEFTQPDFIISKIVIEHDETGRGTITFTKKMFGDAVTDPLQVSTAALERINGAYAALNFIDSSESYQYEKDYSHLGVTTFRLKKGDKQRTTVFNYTVNKDAKILADEYRRLANQFIWVFDITVARENQPLETPRLLDALDGYLRRNEISDPLQMVPLLKGMKDDERIPLITRNHSAKLVERIEKGKK